MVDFGRVLEAGLRVFGEDVTYTAPGAPSGETVRGVFDEAHEEVSIDAGVQVSSVSPMIGVKLDTFTTAPVQGGRFLIQGTTYAVVDVRPDGQGGAEIPLHEVPSA